MTLNIYILAAGQSTRYGTVDKLTVAFKGKPLCHWAIENALKAQVGPVFLVHTITMTALLPPHDMDVKSLLVQPAQPLSDRLHQIATHARAHDAGCLVLLGDMPLVSVKTIQAVAACPSDLARAWSGTQPGFPVKVGRGQLDLLDHASGERGLKAVLDSQDVARVEVPRAETQDFDTPQDLEAFHKAMPAQDC